MTGLRGGMAAAVAGLVVASLAVAAVAPAAGATADQFITMSSSTDPVQPTTGEAFTFSMTFQSADQSGGSVTIEHVDVHDGADDSEPVIAEKSYPGGGPTLAPGSSVRESVDLSFDEPGVHEVYVEVTFEVDGKLVVTSYRTNVTVYRPNPGIQVSAAPTTAGERTEVTVDVANGLEGTIRDVELSLSADGVDFDDRTRVASSVGGGQTTTFEYTATPESLGDQAVEARLSYTTPDGTRRHVTKTIDVRFRSPDFAGDVGFAAEVKPAIPGADTVLNLTLTNGLDVAIRQLEVTVTADGATVTDPRKVATGFESGSQRTFRYRVSRAEPGRQPIQVAVRFTTAEGVEATVTETLSTTFDAPANPGEVRLTGVSATRTGSNVEISATASNVGSSPVSSVIVAVGDDAPVARSDYFVGNIEGGDFASFTLTTTAEGNLSSVPVTVTYVVDDVERSVTTEVPVERAGLPPSARDSGGGSDLPLVVGLVVLVVLAGAALVYHRRR